MAKVMVTEEYLTNTGNAIREKNGTSNLYTPAQFAGAIRAIDTTGNTGSKSVTANGTYNASSDNLDGYDTVTVNVQNSYSSSDEGKVVSSGALVAQTATTKDANGTYDTTTNNSVTVNVQPNVGSKSISANGNYTASSDSLDGYSSVSVDVPNSYTASDEGKVVSSGALVAQTSRNVTANGTYDTTANNSVVVDVPTGGVTPSGTIAISSNGTYDVANYASANVNVPSSSPSLGTKTITQNGTYNASSDSLDGYSQVTVNVSASGGDSIDWDMHFTSNGLSASKWVDDVSGVEMAIDQNNCSIVDGKLVVSSQSHEHMYIPIDDGNLMIKMKCSIPSSYSPANHSYWYQQSGIFGYELGGNQQDWGVTMNGSGKLTIGYSERSTYPTTKTINDGAEHEITAIHLYKGITALFLDGEYIGYSIETSDTGTAMTCMYVYSIGPAVPYGDAQKVIGTISEIAIKYLPLT